MCRREWGRLPPHSRRAIYVLLRDTDVAFNTNDSTQGRHVLLSIGHRFLDWRDRVAERPDDPTSIHHNPARVDDATNDPRCTRGNWAVNSFLGASTAACRRGSRLHRTRGGDPRGCLGIAFKPGVSTARSDWSHASIAGKFGRPGKRRSNWPAPQRLTVRAATSRCLPGGPDARSTRSRPVRTCPPP